MPLCKLLGLCFSKVTYKNRMLPNDLFENFRFQDLNECLRTFTLNYDELFATCAGFIISIGRLSARFGVAYKPSVKKRNQIFVFNNCEKCHELYIITIVRTVRMPDISWFAVFNKSAGFVLAIVALA